METEQQLPLLRDISKINGRIDIRPAAIHPRAYARGIPRNSLKAPEKDASHLVIKITDKQARYFASEAISRDCDLVMQVLRKENILPVSVFRTFYTNQIAIDWLAPQLKKPEVLANKNVQKLLRSFGFSF
ncbi:hypothetical protein [uncultured Parasutterella sp.]|uniref:hypothetical protein n=2 Tax=uncultured Parasutterella sp. TaxID=1263098 RepID=UPI0025B2A30A|nr:hypothetical protein [uncultured Parasutterella sp.]